MFQYIVRRLILILPVLLGVMILTFFLMYVVPGDPVLTMLGQHADDESIARLREQLHLNDPWYVQLLNYITRTIRGDLGKSYLTHIPVREALAQKLANTARLALSAIIVATFMGVSLGIISAVFQHTWIDHLAMTLALLFVSTPIFWFGMVLVFFFAMQLGWFPISGMGDGSIRYLVLPAITLGSRFAAFLARYTRSVMLEVIREDYIRTARAKGVKEVRVILKHALKNVLIPITTVIGMNLASLLNGSVLTESIFAWPGFGRYVVEAIQKRDFQVIAGSVLVGAIIIVFFNLLVDILYVALDPRIKFE